MPPRRSLPPDILKEMNKAAFNGRARDIKGAFEQCSYDELIDMFADKDDLKKHLKEIAFQERAEIFRTLLFKFRHDDDCLRAILDGFKADERFNASADSDGWGAGPDYKDLEKKREAIRELLILLAKENKDADVASATDRADDPARAGIHLKPVDPASPQRHRPPRFRP